MIRLYNALELSKPDIPNNLIACGLYYHGEINELIGNDVVYVSAIVSAKNDQISNIDLPEFRKDGIYDSFTMINDIKYDLTLFYWKLRTKQQTIIHRGLAVINTDTESIKNSRKKYKSKKMYL